jgi:hypothetical protein
MQNQPAIEWNSVEVGVDGRSVWVFDSQIGLVSEPVDEISPGLERLPSQKTISARLP